MKTKIIISLIIAFAIIIACFISPCDDVRSDNTCLVIKNNTKDSAMVFLTLSGYPPSDTAKYVQNVNGIFGIVDTGLVGAFYLGAGDSVSYTSKKWLSGNICFGSQPLNCSNGLWPMGVNLFEFNLNCGQESIDISTMAGANSIMKVNLIGGPVWVADTFMDVRVIENSIRYKNTGRVGVYPFGCTGCTDTIGKQFCQTPAETPNTIPICNPTRAKGVNGGIVKVEFNGYISDL